MPADTMIPPHPTDLAGAPPTSLYRLRQNKLRWTILALISAMFFITFLDKAVISATAPLISNEFHIDKSSMGLIFSAFALASAIGQIPAGWLADRFGPRRTLTLGVGAWSLITMLTAGALGVVSFVSIRFLTGLAESAAFPGGTRALVPWFRKSERGFVQGAPHLFGRLATAVVPITTVSIAALWGWRAVFYAFGILGLLWALLFFRIYRDSPETHPTITQDELALITSDADHAAVARTERALTPWGAMFASGTTWGLIIGSAAYTYCIFFYTTWLPTYLVSHHQLSMMQMGVMSSLPLLAGMAGDVGGGLISDRIMARTGRTGLARKAVVIPAFLLSAIALVPAALTDSAYLSVAYLSVSLFLMELMTGPWWAVPGDVAGPHAGTLSGVMNMAANVAGAFSPVVFGVLAQNGQWIAPFMISAVILVIGAVAWAILVDPDTKIAAAA